MSDGALMHADASPAQQHAHHWPRRREPVRTTVLPLSAHVRAWVHETATERAVAQMFNDFDRQEPSDHE